MNKANKNGIQLMLGEANQWDACTEENIPEYDCRCLVAVEHISKFCDYKTMEVKRHSTVHYEAIVDCENGQFSFPYYGIEDVQNRFFVTSKNIQRTGIGTWEGLEPDDLKKHKTIWMDEIKVMAFHILPNEFWEEDDG